MGTERGRIGRTTDKATAAVGDASRKAAGAMAGLYDAAIDKAILSEARVGTVEDAEALIATGGADAAAMTERIQSVVVAAQPLMRRLSKAEKLGSKVPGLKRMPWVLAVTTTTSMTLAMRQGVKEAQAVAALLAHRIEAATGRPADPALVKRATVELLLAPTKAPDVAARRPRATRLMRRWLLGSVVGLESRSKVRKALQAVDRLDVKALADTWQLRYASIDVTEAAPRPSSLTLPPRPATATEPG